MKTIISPYRDSLSLEEGADLVYDTEYDKSPKVVQVFDQVGNTLGFSRSFTKRAIVTLSGTTGTAYMRVVGELRKLITFDTDLKTTIDAFVSDHAAAYAAAGITVTAGEVDTLIFDYDLLTAAIDAPEVAEASDDLAGTVEMTEGSWKITIPDTGEAQTGEINIIY